MLLVATDALVTGGAVAVALGAFKAITAAIEKIRPVKTPNGKAPPGYYGKMLALSEAHLGPAAIDNKSGTPRWWGNRAVTVLEDILAEMQDGSDAVVKREILAYLRESDECRERIEVQRQGALEAQTQILGGIADAIENCEYCQDAKHHLGDQ